MQSRRTADWFTVPLHAIWAPEPLRPKDPMATQPPSSFAQGLTQCPRGPAAGGRHQGMTGPSPRTPPPKDHKAEVWGKEDRLASVTPTVRTQLPQRKKGFKVNVSTSREAKKKSHLNGARFADSKTSRMTGLVWSTPFPHKRQRTCGCPAAGTSSDHHGGCTASWQ